MSNTLELALMAQILVWLVVLGAFLASGQASIFHPVTIYLGFHGLVFVVRPLLVYFMGFDSIWNYMVFQPSDEDLIKTLMVTSVALVCFSGTCLWAGRSNMAYGETESELITQSEWRALILVTALLAPLIAYSIIRSNTGGFTGENHGGVYVLTGDSGYVVEAQFMATPLLCIWLAATRFKWQGLVPLTLYVGYRAYCGWMRWTLVLFFVALALAFCWQHRRKWLPLWMIVFSIPLLILFHALGQRRGLVQAIVHGESISQTISDSASKTANLPARERDKIKYDTQDFANFDYLTFVLATVPEKTGTYTYGSQYVQLFTEPIPRKLWPGKPAGAPIGFFNLNNYGNFNGLTVSLPGDGWMSGGWIGLIITMTFFGLLWGRLHCWFWKNNSRFLFSMFYLITLAVSPQQFRDGGISIAKFFFWNLSPVILWTVASWLTGCRQIPVCSVLLPAGAKLRFRTRAASETGRATAFPNDLAGRKGASLP